MREGSFSNGTINSWTGNSLSIQITLNLLERERERDADKFLMNVQLLPVYHTMTPWYRYRRNWILQYNKTFIQETGVASARSVTRRRE